MAVLFSSFKLHAQDSITHDVQLWNYLAMQYDAGPIVFEIGQGVRQDQNLAQTDKNFVELKGECKIIGGLKTGVQYRYEIKDAKKGSKYFNRISGHIKYKQKLNRWAIGSRIKYQRKSEIFEEPEKRDPIAFKTRFKMSVDYNVKSWKLDPQISAELFRATEENGEGTWEKWRYALGSEYNFTKKDAVEFGYILEYSLDPLAPAINHIAQISFSTEF